MSSPSLFPFYEWFESIFLFFNAFFYSSIAATAFCLFSFSWGNVSRNKTYFLSPFPKMTPKRKFIPRHSSLGLPTSDAARVDDEEGCRLSKQEDVLVIRCQPRLVTGRKIRHKENGKDFKCDILSKEFLEQVSTKHTQKNNTFWCRHYCIF